MENAHSYDVNHLAELSRVRAQGQGNPVNVIHGQRAVDLPSSRHRQAEVRREMAQIDAVFRSNSS